MRNVAWSGEAPQGVGRLSGRVRNRVSEGTLTSIIYKQDAYRASNGLLDLELFGHGSYSVPTS